MSIANLTHNTIIAFGSGTNWSITTDKNNNVILYQRPDRKSLMGKLKNALTGFSTGLKAAEAHLNSLPGIKNLQDKNLLGSMRDKNNKLTQSSMQNFMNQVANLSEKNREMLSSGMNFPSSIGKTEFSITEMVTITNNRATATPLMNLTSINESIDKSPFTNKDELKAALNTANEFMGGKTTLKKMDMLMLLSTLDSVNKNIKLNETEKNFIKEASEKLNAGINSSKK